MHYVQLTAASEDANTQIASISTTVRADEADLPLLLLPPRLEDNGCTMARYRSPPSAVNVNTDTPSESAWSE